MENTMFILVQPHVSVGCVYANPTSTIARVNPQLKIVLYTRIHLLLQISLLRMTLLKCFIVLRASYTAIIFLDF